MSRRNSQRVVQYATRLAALGAQPRLRIVQLLLSAHPRGRVAGDIQEELGLPASTLSHHLDKLKHRDLILARREGTFLWYTANTAALQELLNFLFAECCARPRANKLARPVSIRGVSKPSPERKKP